VHADADSLIELFEDKTIKSNDLAALLGAHTSSQQQFVDPDKAFAPQDSTPGVWDSLFYQQTLADAASIPKRVFRFPSDLVISQHPQVIDEWTNFGNNQTDWNIYFSRSYVRLSLLGVNNINSLTECTKVLPPAKKTWSAPDKPGFVKWLNMAKNSDKIGTVVADGDPVTNAVLKDNGVSTS
jgi:manganese peroxidase